MSRRPHATATVPVARPAPRSGLAVKLQVGAIVFLLCVGAGWFFLRGPGVKLLPEGMRSALGKPTPAAKPAAQPAASRADTGKPTTSSIPAAPLLVGSTTPVQPGKTAEPTPPVATVPQAPPAPPPVVALPSNPPMPTGTGRNPYEVATDIDRAIHAKLAAQKLTPSSLSDDAEFMRRAYLDLTGKIPTHEQAVRFLDSTDPYKRARLIDELLASPAYGRHFAHYWIDLFVKRDPENNEKMPTGAFRDWLAEQFNSGAGWDKTVTEMLTAQGPEASTPATFFILANQDNNQPAPNKIVGTAGVLFMGIQMQCAECHVHPTTSKWNRQDFWGMAAFFSHVRADRESMGKKKFGPATVTEVGDPPKDPKAKKKNKAKPALPGAVIDFPNPNDSKRIDGRASAKYFEGDKPSLPAQAPYRPYAAKWLTSSQNPYFAPALVNRMWAYFFARGFVNPIDDMHDGNEASHPELLKQLAGEFLASGYDLKHLIRCICNSQTYQRTSRPTSAKEPEEALALFSRVPVKVLTAEMLLDSIAVATGRENRNMARDNNNKGKNNNNNKSNSGGKAGSVAFFDTREYDDDPSEFSYGVPQILNLMNSYLGRTSNEVAARVASASGGNRQKAIEMLYLTVLSRRPRADELSRLTAFVGTQPDATRGYASVFWALVNSAEFICNR